MRSQEFMCLLVFLNIKENISCPWGNAYEKRNCMTEQLSFFMLLPRRKFCPSLGALINYIFKAVAMWRFTF